MSIISSISIISIMSIISSISIISIISIMSIMSSISIISIMSIMSIISSMSISIMPIMQLVRVLLSKALAVNNASSSCYVWNLQILLVIGTLLLYMVHLSPADNVTSSGCCKKFCFAVNGTISVVNVASLYY